MAQNKHIEAQVEEALRSIDTIKRANPQPYFYTRVHARLSRYEMNFWEKVGAIISKPSVALIAICLIISVNTAAIFQQKDTSASTTDQPEIALVDEYNKAINSFYDYENSEP